MFLKDKRYKAIKSLIMSKGIAGLKDVFTILPMSTVKEDMKINYNTLRRRVDAGDTITVRDILAMADLFEVEPAEVFKLILSDIQSAQKVRRK